MCLQSMGWHSDGGFPRAGTRTVALWQPEGQLPVASALSISVLGTLGPWLMRVRRAWEDPCRVSVGCAQSPVGAQAHAPHRCSREWPSWPARPAKMRVVWLRLAMSPG
jgi:hypothetical protein